MMSAMSSAPSKSQLKTPPGPRRLPIIGSMHKLSKSEAPHIAVHQLARQYGDMAMLHLGSVPTVVINHPELMREAFEKDELSGRWVNEAFTCMFEEDALGFAPFGNRWRKLSHFVRHELFSGDSLATLCKTYSEPAIDEAAEQMTNAGGLMNPHNVLYAIEYDLSCRILFGWESNYDDEFRQIKEELRERIAWFHAAAGTRNMNDFFTWLKVIPSKMLRDSRRQMAVREGLIGAMVDRVDRRRRAGLAGAPCMVDAMLAKEEAGEITRLVIHAVCMEILSALTSGVPSQVSWFLLLVANRPEVQAKIHEELDRVIGRDRAPTMDDYKALPYVFACVAECLRYRVIAPFGIGHKSLQEVEVGGYKIPAGVQMFGNIYAVHHDARFWDSPGEYTPERFLPQANGTPAAALTSPAYMPFGVGIRRCTGDYFGEVAVWLHAARLMHRLRFETPEGVPLSEDEEWGLSVIPKPYVLKATRR